MKSNASSESKGNLWSEDAPILDVSRDFAIEKLAFGRLLAPQSAVATQEGTRKLPFLFSDIKSGMMAAKKEPRTSRKKPKLRKNFL